MTASTGGTALEIGAEFVSLDRQTRRTTIDDAADGRTVAFAESGNSK
jgi:hypothetical protein